MRKVLFCLVILITFLILGCSPDDLSLPSSDCSSSSDTSASGPAPANNPDWDKPFGTPQYLIHLTGHGTMDGYRKDDSYLLFPNAPDSKGGLLLPDGEGGTFGYNTDSTEGPFTTPRGVCAAGGSKVGDASLTAWNSNFSFSCKQMAAAGSGNSGSSNKNKCKPPTATHEVAAVATDTTQPPLVETDTPEVAAQPPDNNQPQDQPNGNQPDNPNNGNNGNQPAPLLTAWLSCGDNLELEPSTNTSPEVGAICGVWVKGWQTDTSNPVVVTFPDLQDNFSRLPGGIQVGPGNTSSEPGNMFGSNDDPKAYYFSEIFHAPATAPTEPFTPIRITVSQAGVGQVDLRLNVKLTGFAPGNIVFGVCPDPRTATLTFWNYGDAIGKQTFGPDGVRDGIFRLDLTASDPQSVVTYVRFDSLDANMSPDGISAWDTQPILDQRWYLALVQSTTTQLINMPAAGPDVNLSVPGSASVFMYAEDNGNLVSGKSYGVTVYYGHHTDCYSQATVTIPPIR